MAAEDNNCIICTAEINLLKPCNICETYFCQVCYNLYRTAYNKHTCPMCRNPLPIYDNGLDEELNHAFITYMKKHIASNDEEAKYNNIVELINARRALPHINNYINHINNTVYAHHRQCEKAFNAILFMLIVCILYILLGLACVLSTSPSYERYIALGPINGVMLYIIIKLCKLYAYIDNLTISKAFIEGFITGICLFYSAIVWNNAGTVFAILTWLLNGLTLVVIQSQHCSRRVV